MTYRRCRCRGVFGNHVRGWNHPNGSSNKNCTCRQFPQFVCACGNGAMLILNFLFFFWGVFGLSCVFLVLFGVFVSFYHIVLSIIAVLFDFVILYFRKFWFVCFFPFFILKFLAVSAWYRLYVLIFLTNSNLGNGVSQKLFCVLIANFTSWWDKVCCKWLLARDPLLTNWSMWMVTMGRIAFQHRDADLVRWIHHNFGRNKAKGRANPNIKSKGTSASGGQLRWSQPLAPGLHNNHVIHLTLTTQNSNTGLEGKTHVYNRKQNLHN